MSIIVQAQEAAAAAQARRTPVSDRSIGRILLESGRIKPEDAERALKLHKQEGIRFGEACVRLKLVKEADIAEALSSQFDYPCLRPGQGRLSPELVAAYQPFSKQVEALRALRTQLLLRGLGQENKILAIVSSDRGDGRTFTAANLAVVFSQLGERTLLIDADLRAPRQHELFNLQSQVGLSALLSGRTSDSVVERIQHFANLSVITAGAKPPNPLELLSRAQFKKFLETMSERFDVILVDTPAATFGADAQAIAMNGGAALMILRSGHTRVKEAQGLTHTLADTNCILYGCVMNQF
jgi:receptor protein-tyrosine kinase